MKRRHFISLVAAVPLLGLSQTPKRETADDFISRIYLAYGRGKAGKMPNYIEVSQEIFDEYVSGLKCVYRQGQAIAIKTSTNPYFKACELRSASWCHGHDYAIG